MFHLFSHTAASRHTVRAPCSRCWDKQGRNKKVERCGYEVFAQKKSSVCMRLAFAWVETVVFGYYRHSRDGDSKEGPKQQEREVGQKALAGFLFLR
jgi:hypothetical protein